MTKNTLREQIRRLVTYKGYTINDIVNGMEALIESTSKEARTRGIKDLTVAMEARLANKGLNMPVSRVVAYLEEEKDGLLGSSPDLPALDKQDVRSNDNNGKGK